MKQYIILALFFLFVGEVDAQLSLQDGTSNYLIDFDATVSGVSSGSFTGAGFTNSPTNGQLDADAWAVTGWSDGAKAFGISNTTGDHARGTSTGGVSTGGFYGFDVGGGNRALGIQPTGSDWTPGTLTLKIDNNSTSVINEMHVDYTVYVRNDQNRASTFNFSISYNNSSYSNVSTGAHTTPQASGGTAWVANNKNIQLSGLQIDPGTSFYIRWAGSDAGGSGSRDELALDDIAIMAAGSTVNCTEPIAQASNLNFGTITSNSIQASFSGGTADKYLIVQSTSASLGGSPLDGVTYSTGNSIGSGEVIQYNNNTTINSLGLTENTTYYYFLFASNDNCSGGPDYLAVNPLSGSATTLQNGNSNYYASIGSETCENLKTALFNLIDGHTSVSYGSLWTHYQTTDDHLNDAGNEVIVWDMYSDNPSGAENEFTFVSEQCGTYQSEGDCYNREHTFPKSWWGGTTSPPQYTDIFTVVPADGWINGIRSNNPYGEVQSGTETQITANGCRLGSSSTNIPGYSGSVFEPRDDYKGDLARGYFYMATRYQNVIATWENSTTESSVVLDGTSYTVFEPWMVNLLTVWHNNDPVDQKEIDRNEAIYAIQGNRNPYIDHPEYVAAIWSGCDGSDTEAPSVPANLVASNVTQTSAALNWTASNDNIGVTGYKIYQDGVNVLTVSSNSTTVNGLSGGITYAFTVSAIDAAGNESTTSNSVNVTTPNTDTTPPSAPSVLVASNTTETSTDLSWDASTDNVGVTGYKIYQDGVNVLTVSSISSTVNGLSGGITYAFTVSALDAAGNESTTSNSVNVTTPNIDTTPPSAPSVLVASNTTVTSTDLNWNVSTDDVAVTGYNIYQDGSVITTSSGVSTTINGLIGGTTYSFYVTAFDAAGNESNASNSVNVTTNTTSSEVVIHEGYFESGWDGWQDGGSDCARYSGSNSAEGDFSIRIRDNSNTSSAMTSPSFDISGYSTIDIDFSFYPKSMENNEDFWVRYYDGNNWQTIATFTRGVDFNNNVFYATKVVISSSNYNFPSNAKFRFQCDASGNNDHIYIDEVVIIADVNAASAFQDSETLLVNDIDIQILEGIENSSPTVIDRVHVEIEDFSSAPISVYPNPASDLINIDLRSMDSDISQMKIFDVMGREVMNIISADGGGVIQQDISLLKNGLYLLRIVDSNKKIKIVKFYVNH